MLGLLSKSGIGRPRLVTAALVALMGLGTLAGCGESSTSKTADALSCLPGSPAEVIVKGGTFRFGANGPLPEEGPPIAVTVGSFAIDATEVTNDQFSRFVKETGYFTQAEQAPDPKDYPGVPLENLKPSSVVFVGLEGTTNKDPDAVWQVVNGANWRHPLGPQSTIDGKGSLPVVQVSWQDAAAYASWAGRELPTEAEWEFAARGGLIDKRYVWGDEHPTKEMPRANHWQGVFPFADNSEDGYKAQSSPVGCFAPNCYGLYDMAGNVWEWTADWYKPNVEGSSGPRMSEAFDPHEPGVSKHVMKGGSFLCADNYCYRYRPAARQAGPTDTGSSHVGFRTIRRLAK